MLTSGRDMTLNAATGIGALAAAPVVINSVTGNLSASNTTSGALFLQTGNITLGSASTTLSEVAGGTLRVDAINTVASNIIIGGDLTVAGAGTIELNAINTLLTAERKRKSVRD